MQPDPIHVNQFRTVGARGKYLCTAAVGAMALDAFTGGSIRATAARIDDLQDDHAGGIGLDDVAVAWRRGWGLTFSHGPRSWGTVMARLRAGDGAALQGRYAVVPTKYRAQKDFTGGHAIYVSRQVRPGWLRVFDPIATTATEWPESVAQAFYLSGLALAGWGSGSSAISGLPPAPTPAATTVGQVVRVSTATPVASCTVVTTLTPGPLGDLQRVIPIPRANLADDCTVCPTGWSKAWYAPSPVETIFGGWIPLDQTNGRPNACVAPGVKVGDSGPASNLGGIADAGGEAIAGAIGEAIQGLAPALTPIIYLVAILALVLLGLYFLVKGP